MSVIWNPDKEKWLHNKRGINLSEIAEIIDTEQFYSYIKNPAREGQYLYIIPYQNYTYAVPVVIDDAERIVIKTAYPCRKYHNKYGDKNEK